MTVYSGPVFDMAVNRSAGKVRAGGQAGTFPVISGLDHLVVLVDDIAAGAKAYEALLGRSPSWRSQSDGSEAVLFTLDNMTLELMAPAGNSPTADRIRDVIKIWGEGLASICFRVDDIAKMHRRLDRVALKPDPVAEVESRDLGSGATLHWKRTRAATDLTRGVRMFFLELAQGAPALGRNVGGADSGPRSRRGFDRGSRSGPRRSMARGSGSIWRSTARTRTGAS